MTDIDITLKGDAYRVVPGETYVIEIERSMPADYLDQVRRRFEELTDAKCVILMGAHIVPAEPVPPVVIQVDGKFTEADARELKAAIERLQFKTGGRP